eukprot:g5421.t1
MVAYTYSTLIMDSINFNELFGSFFFMSAVLGSGGDAMKVAAGLVVAASVTGAGFNSAANIAGIVDGGNPKAGLMVVAAQLAGGFLALQVHNYFNGESKQGNGGPPDVKELAAEVLSTMMLALAAAKGDAWGTATALYVAANTFGGCDMNPMVTFVNFVNTNDGDVARLGATIGAQVVGWVAAGHVAGMMN